MAEVNKVSKANGANAKRDTARANTAKSKSKENVDFSKAKAGGQQSNTIVVAIKDVSVLKTPEKYINSRNILTVIENYEKEHKDKTLLGDFLKEDSLTREERKNGAIKTFEILYQKALSGAKTDFQKHELARLKTEFDKTVTSEMDDSWFEWGISTSKINKIVATVQKMYTSSSEELANEIYTHADDNHFSYGDKDFRYLLESINAGNAIDIAKKVKNHPKNKNHDSLLRVLHNEFTSPLSDEQKTQKKAQMKNFVTSYFSAAGYKDSEYYDRAKELLENQEIDKLETLMDALLIKKPKEIASSLYKIIDDNSFSLSRIDIKILMDKINSSNVNDVLNEFKNISGSKSLLTMIKDEWGDEKYRKTYLSQIVNAQVDASGFASNKDIAKHINTALNKEDLDDIENLIAALGKNKDINYMSKALFKSLSEDKNNVDKEYVHYLLDGIDEKNVVKFLEEFNKISDGVPITQFLQNKGNKTAQEYILAITDKLLDANKTIFTNPKFNETFGISQSDVQEYIGQKIKNKDDITRVVNSLLQTTPKHIAKNIEDIASSKTGAADDISFKLWISRINPQNVKAVIAQYKEMYGNNTPINAIIEERWADASNREKLIHHVLSSVVERLGKDKANTGIIEEFKEQLHKELFSFGIASASKLNKHLEGLTAGIPENNEFISPTNDTTIIKKVRPNLPEINLGQKYGKFSWQYSNLKEIKSAEDVAKFLGISVDYIAELKESEGVKSGAYKCSANKKTIGIGHNFESTKGAEKEYLNTAELSESEIYQILAHDLFMAINKLQQSRGIDTLQLTKGEYEALLDISFNAPGYMNTLSEKTNKAISLRVNGNTTKAQKAFDEAACEFNQQYSNGQITPGLCKRRVRNILRYLDVKNLNQLPKDSEARKRVITLAVNGYEASSLIRKRDYLAEICNILDITTDQFNELERSI